jgi:hypothetical protein
VPLPLAAGPSMAMTMLPVMVVSRTNFRHAGRADETPHKYVATQK